MKPPAKDRVVGIDPDLQGAACIATAKHYFFLERQAKAAPRMEIVALSAFLKKHKVELVVLEKPRTSIFNPRSKTRTFKGLPTKWENYGRITGILDLLGIKYLEVNPRAWKSKLKLSKEKQESIDLANKKGFVVPKKTTRHKNPHHGLAEAFLLTVYYYEHIL